LPVATRAGDLNLCGTRNIWAHVRVTRDPTWVATWPQYSTWLCTGGAGARARVAGLGTCVSATVKLSPTWLTTGDPLYQAGDILPLLVSPVAQFGGQVGAGGTLQLTVTVVTHRMRTVVLSSAQFSTLWRSGATRHWRVEHSTATVAGELRETDIGAGVAVSPVTEVLTPVECAGEQPATQQCAGVFYKDTAQLSTFVSTTRPFLGTPLATPGIISPCGQL